MKKKIFQESLFPELDQDALKLLKQKSKEKYLIRNNKMFGLEYCKDAIFSGKYGIPLLKAYTGPIPERYTTYSNVTYLGDNSCCVTGFDLDFVLDEIWDNPEKFAKKSSNYLCVTEPDFSLKINHPHCVQIANTYRSHAIGYYLQEHGSVILPCMGWSSTMSFDYCFDGHTKGGAVIVSTIGTLRDERSRRFFRLGFNEMLKRISPEAVILYGDINEEIDSWMPKQLDIHHFDHYRFKRARNHGK